MQYARDLLSRGLSNLQASSSSSNPNPLDSSSSRPSTSTLPSVSNLVQTLTSAISQSFPSQPNGTTTPAPAGRDSDPGEGLPPPTAANAPTAAAPISAEALSVQVQRFKQELAGSCINIQKLSSLAFNGIPNKDNLRGVVWKLLLGYLPPSPEDWHKALAKRRTQYHIFCDELMLDKRRLGQPPTSPLSSAQQAAAAEEPEKERWPLEPLDSLQPHDVTSHDHPLSLSQSSQWNMYFQDSEVMSQVERDVLRTHPSMHFFTGDSPDSEMHREEIKRALFLYAKLNPGLRYIQGMNELIAPLYYLFKNDPDLLSRQYAEADSFWCFMELISEFRDHFCSQLDNAQTGIRATLKRFMAVLRHHDEALWRHIEVTHKVDPQYYSFRWITLLLSQEFCLPDTLRIWDCLLSDPHGRMDCLMRICTALVLHVKPQLMQGDFTVIMKTLQRYPPVDINVILHRAASLTPCKDIPGFHM